MHRDAAGLQAAVIHACLEAQERKTNNRTLEADAEKMNFDGVVSARVKIPPCGAAPA